MAKLKNAYSITPTNWFKSQPYGFAFNDKDKKQTDDPTIVIYLPIAPSNIQITTHFATNVITTLYGIIEEHSEVRYYDIVIQGTTGFAPRYPGPISDSTEKPRASTNGRDSFSSSAIQLGGFLPEVTNTINQVAKLATSIANLGEVKNETGIKASNSGYAAFHRLYRFFLKYKQDTAGKVADSGPSFQLPGAFGPELPSKGGRQKHPLQFLNYKDGNKYDCIPMSFNMSKSADNPMLYNYVIRLRAFNLRSVSDKGVGPEDLLSKLGLGDAKDQSLFSELSAVAGNAATLISGIF